MTKITVRDYSLRTPAKSGVGIRNPGYSTATEHAASVFFIVVSARTSE
ncbi:TPA: ash family protein [Escherichia coli]|nr:hypothetical protein [Escherichia coli]HBC2924772.1 ash family protein [Escherichia coli O146]HDQ6619524.1 ash family protein [Escherichia coli O128:H2]HDQ6802554.1 ash family protein [Escherichia coli O22:H16]HDQ6812619.1 ash family protein [Escherichia coli O174:H8]